MASTRMYGFEQTLTIVVVERTDVHVRRKMSARDASRSLADSKSETRTHMNCKESNLNVAVRECQRQASMRRLCALRHCAASMKLQVSSWASARGLAYSLREGVHDIVPKIE
jgi:hypothetical protein